MMLRRAASLSSGATASSRSRNTMSAALRAAFSNRPGLDPGTASSERCRRGVACSIRVKLTLSSPRMEWFPLPPGKDASTGGAESGGGTVDRQQQRVAHFLVAAAAELPQQADLLAADPVQRLQ